MKDEEALELVNETFKKLIESKTINDVNEIINRSDILKKNQMSKEKYPKIDFKITSDEIKKLKENAIITNGLISKSIVDSDPPLTKLFYAVLWKNGDLDKLKHIIEGIAVPEDSKDYPENGLVFFQFGKYLSEKSGEPIIDQHVLRAFGIFQIDSDEEKLKFRKFSGVTKDGPKEKREMIVKLIEKYKGWLMDALKKELTESNNEYAYYVDKVLFALGKSIKKK